jgi:hypothetical protein
MYRACEINNNEKEVIMKTYISMSILCLVSMFTMNAYAAPAVVFRLDDSCGGFVPNGDSETGFPPLEGSVGWRGDVHLVGRDAGLETFPGSGKVTCNGYHESELDHANIGKGFQCQIPSADQTQLFITFDSILVASPSGEAMISCQFKKGSTIVIEL